MSEETKEAEPAAMGHPAGLRWERAVFGSGSIEGTMRMVIYAAAFVLVFGTLFFLAQG
jgi:hypothetical protein